MKAEPDDTEASDPSAPSDAVKKDAMNPDTSKEDKKEKDAFLPAPLPEGQRKIAEEWQRPPGQSSG